MCVVPKKSNSDSPSLSNSEEMGDSNETNVSFSHILELVADNDVDGFKEFVELNPNAVDEVGLWYGRQPGGNGKTMVLEYRTPLMVAAMYGSLDVMKLILSLSELHVNDCFGADKTTPLHCAASGGCVDAVKLLLVNGADFGVCDANGKKPFDVITVSLNQKERRSALEDLLRYDRKDDQNDDRKDSKVLTNDELNLSPLTIPTVSMQAKPSDLSPDSASSPNMLKNGTFSPAVSEKKEYPFDPTLPDIKNSMYSTDEFRMYSFKIRPCSRAYSHDWTECPFVHPGENARRRDPRKYNYTCVPCPEFRKGSCRRGDLCEYAHGVFECWLHPAQYRTRLCKDGTSCNRRVCFFAHLPEEVRPVYGPAGSTVGSAVPSPRAIASAAAVMDMAAALNMFPASPSAISSSNPFTPPMSPSGNGSPMGWNQHNIPPSLNLPPGINMNIQASRLRSSLNARDIHSVNDMGFFSPTSGRSRNLAPSNLDEFFSPEISSSPHKSAVMNHFQMQQSMLSPINTKPGPGPFGQSSPRMMSMVDPQSPLNARLAALSMLEKQHQMRSLSARDFSASLPRDMIGSSSPMGPWSSKWDSTNGRADWSVNGDELKRSNSMGHNVDEPDLSWVQSLVKDPSSDNLQGIQNGGVSGLDESVNVDRSGQIGAWLDQMGGQ